ncbi:hypothetical protein [Methylobacterium sp. D48H]
MMKVYVEGVHRTCADLRVTGSPNITVFYPSTIFVEERPANLTECAMAKDAGEKLYIDLPRMLKGVRGYYRRLPRLPTDQTSSVQPVEMASVEDVMLDAIRAVS